MKLIKDKNSIPAVVSSIRTNLLLRQEDLLPGDIILSFGDPTIALATRGPFSHAAIVFNSTAAFESRGDGVGFSPLVPVRCERNPGTGLFDVLVTPIDSSSIRGVFRHRNIHTITPSVISSKLRQLVSEELGCEYPEYTALKEAAKGFTWIPDFFFRKNHSKKKPLVVNPGSFCSQLVAKFYQSLGLPLFIDDPQRTTYSPNAIARSQTLRFEDSIIVEPDSSAETDEKYLAELNLIPLVSRAFLSVLVEGHRALKQAEELNRMTSHLLDKKYTNKKSQT